MAECKVCEKELTQEAGEIGSWCIDCIGKMSETNTGNMEAKRDSIKREMLIIMIFAAIGAVGGIFFGISANFIFGGIWILSGLGAGLGYFICGFVFDMKMEMATGKPFGEALKEVLRGGILFLILGLFGGIAFILFLILRRIKWMKKLNAITASEDAAIAELKEYTLGKDINKADLSRKVSIIADNFELANDGVSLKDLKQLRMVQ
jgi:hypothetical protein